MYPEICKIGPFTIYSYGAALVTAFVVAINLAMRQAKREGIAPELIFNFAFTAFVCGISGARIFYILMNLNFFLSNPREIIMLQHGGLAWFGGLIAGCASGLIYLKIKKLSILKVLDLIVPFLALAQSIGRIGCLLNGCCYGRHSAFGVYFPVHDAILIPTQAYSSLLLLIIFVILRFLQARPHSRGAIFFAYLLLYGAKRFLIEFLRDDSSHMFLGLTIFQVLSAIVFFIGLAGLLLIKKNPKKYA